MHHSGPITNRLCWNHQAVRTTACVEVMLDLTTVFSHVGPPKTEHDEPLNPALLGFLVVAT